MAPSDDNFKGGKETMKKFTVLLLIVGLAVVLTASSVFAMTDSFRAQATAGLFGSNDDDAADNFDDPVDVIRKFPKWVLLTRFSNLLNPAGSSSDKIFEYGAGDRDTSSPSRTFYGLMGSSEWFETNLGMPINFAVSYERTGSRMPLLDPSTGDLAFDSTAVTSVTGDDSGFTDRQAYLNTAFTETNFTVGYKVNDQLHAGVNWLHNSDNSTYANDGELETTDTFTYGNGLAGTTLTLDANDVFLANARYAVSDDVHVKGEVALGLHRGQDNYATEFESEADAITGGTGGLPGSIEADTAATKSEVSVKSSANALIFGLKGKVYYFPLNKGQITSELGYRYVGGAISKEEINTEEGGVNEYEDTYTLTGTQTQHTITWDTRKYIELDKINVRLGLKMTRSSDTISGKEKLETDVTTGVSPHTDYETDLSTMKNVTWTWGFPVGAELTLKEKWTLRVGADHKVNLLTDSVVTTGDFERSEVTQTASRSTAYTYGVGYDWSENLKLDINAFLEETAPSSQNQSILDLATYRNVAISAALIF
jgi:hypothetical protein